VPVAKRGGIRWLTVLDDRASARYAAAVAAVAATVEASLTEAVMANRVGSAEGASIRLEAWLPSRARFLLEAERRSADRGALLLADVRDCYRSIRPQVVEARLRAIGCAPAAVGGVVDVLSNFEVEGIRGLPVGPEPSAVLANAVLAVGDEAVARCRAEHLRWVDDFVVFADDSGHALHVLRALSASLGRAGLSLSPTKTRIVEDPSSVGRGGTGAISPAGAGYHRCARAHPLPCFEGPYPLTPTGGGVAPGRWAPRGAGRDR
jgi:hypothetical protein